MLSKATGRRHPRIAGATLVVSLLALTGCAAEGAPQASTPPPTLAPEQSISEACGVSLGELESIMTEMGSDIEQAISAAAGGQLPNLNELFDPIRGSLARVSGEITNAELRAAIDAIRAEIDGFSQIEAPDSLIDTARYIGDLSAQAASLHAAGTELRQLCAL